VHRVLDLYRGESLRTRVHTTIRWRTCPFERIADAVPATGRVLEIGCGHGLLSAYLALESPARSVLGTDVDGDKIRAAQRAATRSGADVTFAPAAPGHFPPGPWNAVAIVDVLYLIDSDGQQRLLDQAAAALSPGGVLVVKEMALEPAWKFRWMDLQERLSVRVLGITEGDELTFVDPNVVEGWMEANGLEVDRRRLDRWYPHPHHLLVGHKPT